MSKHFRPWKIDQTQLLPPSMQDYLPEDHLSRFIVALVRESLDLRGTTLVRLISRAADGDSAYAIVKKQRLAEAAGLLRPVQTKGRPGHQLPQCCAARRFGKIRATVELI